MCSKVLLGYRELIFEKIEPKVIFTKNEEGSAFADIFQKTKGG